jgi:hypothetical protein
MFAPPTVPCLVCALVSIHYCFSILLNRFRYPLFIHILINLFTELPFPSHIFIRIFAHWSIPTYASVCMASSHRSYVICSSAMNDMGDKINSKKIAKAAGCFVIPGFEGRPLPTRTPLLHACIHSFIPPCHGCCTKNFHAFRLLSDLVRELRITCDVMWLLSGTQLPYPRIPFLLWFLLRVLSSALISLDLILQSVWVAIPFLTSSMMPSHPLAVIHPIVQVRWKTRMTQLD